MNHIIEAITNYKTKSADPIRDQQVAYIPRLANEMIDYVIPYYILEGNRVIANVTNQMFVKLRYLKFVSMAPHKLLPYRHSVNTMIDLVNKNIIAPFIVFINGYFVPWEYINIVMDAGNYYLVFNGNQDKYYADLYKACDYIQILMLPEYAEYVTNYTGNSYDAMFTFDTLGQFATDSIKYAFVPKNAKYRINFNYWHSTTDVNGFVMLRNTDIKLTDANIVLFVNGKFGTGEITKVKRANDDEYRYEDTGKICPCLEFTESSDDIFPNPTITVEGSILTIGNGINSANDMYDFAVFINPYYTTSIDNVSLTDPNQLFNIIQSKNYLGILPEYYTDLMKAFEMEMTFDKSYEENLADAIKTVMTYNTSLFSPVLQKKSNLIIEEHNAEWIYANITDAGTIDLSVAHNHMVDERVVVLYNGELYKNYSLCTYKANKFSIPMPSKINTEDVIEFLRFQNVNNYETSITINEDDGFVYYNEYMINNSMALFCPKEYHEEIYTYPDDGIQHFEIGYTLEKDEAGRTKIILEDPFYYGKELTLAYKNRFKYFTFRLKDDAEYDEYILDLSDKFMYCSEYSRYMVFLNGRRLLSTHYRLVLPTRPTTPYSDFKIYLTIPMVKGDKLDIIYTPSLIQDVVINNTINTSGDISMEKSALDYGFSTDLYMVWINGKKIPRSHIHDIDSTRLRITSDEKSTNTLCITKYIPSVDVLNEVFDNNESLWDTIASKMSAAEINALLGINTVTITNIEPNIYEGAADIKAIMHELIRDEFLLNPNVEVTGPFAYDYLDVDTTIIKDINDSEDNVLLDSANANHEDNLAVQVRSYL